MYLNILEIISDDVINNPVSPPPETNNFADNTGAVIIIILILISLFVFLWVSGGKAKEASEMKLISDVKNNSGIIIFKLFKTNNSYIVENRLRDIKVVFSNLSEAKEYIDFENKNYDE